MLTVVGEALIDEVIQPGSAAVAHVGGSPMNVAVGLARLGHPTQFLGRWGKDEYGDLIAEHLRENQVLVPFAADELPTSIARATIADDGAASYIFDLDWDLQNLQNRWDVLLESTSVFHTGSIAAFLAPGAEHVMEAVKIAHGKSLISFDPNCRPSIVENIEHARTITETFVGFADVVKASDEDLQWLYPGMDPLDSARAWFSRERSPEIIIVTRGKDGPWAITAAGELQCAAVKVEVADTVGAGDSFMAAFLSALVDRGLDGANARGSLNKTSAETWLDILNHATRAAAITVSRAGANPPTREEMS